MHAFLKNYIDSNKNNHEVKIGPYYVDILNEEGVYEIQTKQLFRLRKKLHVLLPEYVVTIVLPLIKTKTIYWIDTTSNEVSKGRKSPKKCTWYDVFSELYAIKDLLDNSNMKIMPILLDVDEYRLLNGWSYDKKKGSTCHDRIVTNVHESMMIASKEDYCKLVPDSLAEDFSSKDFAKEAHTSIKNARLTLNILRHLGVVKQISKKGNLLIYNRSIQKRRKDIPSTPNSHMYKHTTGY
ncbi:MAG TPA: hypothetical protein PLI11_10855 [Clostridia bacterium]|jgi:hypothetical protein|nr:hypothetical protein [Clostridia bacterium]HPZ53408.1 hypothetical protein [Clostridia bacterium]